VVAALDTVVSTGGGGWRKKTGSSRAKRAERPGGCVTHWAGMIRYWANAGEKESGQEIKKKGNESWVARVNGQKCIWAAQKMKRGFSKLILGLGFKSEEV
jgi:hypothetical protein